MPGSPPLAGKVAIISLGPGEASDELARRLAATGAAVVLVAGPDRAAQERAGRLAAEVEASGMGRPAVFVLDAVDAVDAVDARDPAQLDGLVGFVTELFGP